MELTPSQTVGPFYGLGLIDARWAPAIEAATPGQRIRIKGCVLDGDGAPVIDGMLESWQADAGGIRISLGSPLRIMCTIEPYLIRSAANVKDSRLR